MKKLLVSMLSLSLMLSLFSINSFAGDYSANIKSPFKYAEQLSEELINEFIAFADNVTYENECYYIRNNAKPLNQNTYYQETLVIVPVENDFCDEIEKKINHLISTRGNGNNTYSEWDSSGAICATVYVEYSTISNGNYGKLTYVSTSRTNATSGVVVSDSSVSYGSLGAGYQNTYAWGQNNTVNLGNSKNWSTYTPSSWNYVNLNADHLIGATYSLTLHRGTSSHYWNLTVPNNPI